MLLGVVGECVYHLARPDAPRPMGQGVKLNKRREPLGAFIHLHRAAWREGATGWPLTWAGGLTVYSEEHMRRVVAQGDLRPMAGNLEAMNDLKRILAGREAFYAKADLSFDTDGKALDDAYVELRASILQRIPEHDHGR